MIGATIGRPSGNEGRLAPRGPRFIVPVRAVWLGTYQPVFADGHTEGSGGSIPGAPAGIAGKAVMCGWSQDTDGAPGADGERGNGTIEDSVQARGDRHSSQEAPAANAASRSAWQEEHEDTLLRFAFGDR
jgi:hypothetical protein